MTCLFSAGSNGWSTRGDRTVCEYFWRNVFEWLVSEDLKPCQFRSEVHEWTGAIDDKDVAHSDVVTLPSRILGDIAKDSCVLVPARTNHSKIDEVSHIIFVRSTQTGQKTKAGYTLPSSNQVGIVMFQFYHRFKPSSAAVRDQFCGASWASPSCCWLPVRGYHMSMW